MENKTSFSHNSKYLLISSKVYSNNNKLFGLPRRYVSINTKADESKGLIDPNVLALVNDKSQITSKDIYKIENLRSQNTKKDMYTVKNLLCNQNLDKDRSLSTKEWANSVYTYNKNYTRNLPVARNVLNNLLTSYFNLTSLINGNKLKTKAILEKKSTLNKTFVSKAEVKITNDKVNLTVHVYNRNKKTILHDLIESLGKTKKSYKKGITVYKEKNKWIRSLKKRTIHAKNEIIKSLQEKLIVENKNVKMYNTNSHLLTKNFSFSKYSLRNHFSNYLNAFYLKKLLSLYYMREVILNNNLFKNWYLLGLKKTISKLYNKKVELNIVNQKYYYFNSDIFTKAIATRVRNRNNRITHVMRNALHSIPLARFESSSSSKLEENNSNLQLTSNGLKRNIFNSIKYKHIQGVRLEAAGRLTLRLTAARSLSKVASKGNLKNFEKIYLNKSFTLLRGHAKPNVQYTTINSKTRNGAFGLKGWVNGN